MDLDRIRSRSQRRARGEYRAYEHARRGMCFLQHDQVIANADGATVRSDINNALASLFSLSSGTAAPSTTIAYQFWADTTNGLLKQRNAANTNWIVRGTLAETQVVARSSNTILAATDFAKTFNLSSTFTQTLTAAATLGDGWYCFLSNAGAGVITIDANSSETIDGNLTIDLQPGEGITIICSGTAFVTQGRSSQFGLLSGMMIDYPVTGLPTSGFLECDGSNVSRATYAALLAKLVKSTSVTITIATPGVVTWNAHGLSNGDVFKATTTGALPTGLTAGTTYFVRNKATNTFELSLTEAGASINTTGSQSGVHTGIHAPYGDGDGSTTFGVPDSRRRSMVGRGGTPTTTLGARVGASGGEETHILTSAESAAHVHFVAGDGGADSGSGLQGTADGGAVGGRNSNSSGGGGAHNVYHPVLIVTKIIKT